MKYNLTQKQMEDIANVAFTARGNKFELIQGIDYSKTNLQEFVANILRDINNGTLTKTNSDKTKSKQLRPMNGINKIVKIQKAIQKYIHKNFPS